MEKNAENAMGKVAEVKNECQQPLRGKILTSKLYSLRYLWIHPIRKARMTRIYVARHGQNEDNANGILNGHRDLPLTEIGRGQARELANRILAEGLKFDMAYCSPLVRASETAEIVAAICDLPAPRVLPELIERDFGEMTGKPIASIRELCGPHLIETPTVTYFLKPAGGEEFDDVLARARTTISHMLDRHDGQNILLVCHGDMGKMLAAAYFGIPWAEALVFFHLGNSELIELSRDTAPASCHRIALPQHNA
jgi:broad specificity phosphatase PhoE